MRAGDAATNLPLLAALRAGGFELVRSLRVWASHSDRGPVFLMDSVYLRVEHFVRSGGLPAAALGFLLSQPTQRDLGSTCAGDQGVTAEITRWRSPRRSSHGCHRQTRRMRERYLASFYLLRRNSLQFRDIFQMTCEC